MLLQLGTQTIAPCRVFCIGCNYDEHIRELAHERPASPVIFLKPAASLVPVNEPINCPRHGTEFHYEAELVVLIGKEGRACHLAGSAFIYGRTIARPGLDHARCAERTGQKKPALGAL